MKPNRTFRRLAPITVALTVSVAVTAQNQAVASWVLTMPTRRAALPAPPTLPELPPAARTVAAATIHLAMYGENARSKPERQIITRTAERIHVVRDDGREWFFERNPIDSRRVSAAAIEHASREIVLYAETDLRMVMGIRGWADVLWLGFDQGRLAQYRATVQTRLIDGVEFTRYTAAKGGQRSGADIWWSPEQQLASTFTVADKAGTSRLLVESISPVVDAAKLEPPTKRFPKYTVINVADWLERH